MTLDIWTLQADELTGDLVVCQSALRSTTIYVHNKIVIEKSYNGRLRPTLSMCFNNLDTEVANKFTL